MLVYNLTDVPTTNLTRLKLVNTTFVVGQRVLQPGTAVEISDPWLRMKRAGLQDLVTQGVASVGPQPPASYIIAKQGLTLQTKSR